MRHLFLLCSYLAIFGGGYSQSQDAESLEVDLVDQGRVRGYKAPGFDVFTFYSIPYATAPTGRDKFKAPLPPRSWNDTFEAVDKKIVCPQYPAYYGLSDDVSMQEDCLIANVMAPDTDQINLPVLVIIHGGGFQVGYGNEWPTVNLVNSKRIVAVNFNYRLSIHGFLCLGNEAAPGNAGFKDQIALLRWVKKNIARFGGNPDDITLSGCSAGGASVDLHAISKLSEGLINKVLPESGHNNGGFAVQFDPLQNAKSRALFLNFTDVDNIDALTKFYQDLSYEILTLDDFMHGTNSAVNFSACIEKDLGQEMFLEEAPINIMRNRDFKPLPMFFGYANLEGAWRYDVFFEWKDLMNEKFSDFLPADLVFENNAEKEALAARVKEFYFGNEAVGNDTMQSYVDYLSDVMFVQAILRSADLQVRAGNKEVYLYEYGFARSDRPVTPTNMAVQGASHCDQTDAVLDEGDESNLPQDYQEMKKIMRELWLNFIEYGNPTPAGHTTLPTWPPLGEGRSPYYSLGRTVQVETRIPVQDRTLFWDAIYEKHYRTPIPPNP